MRKIGLYGGTFDPFHNGHLSLAIEIKERCQLEEIWIIPTQLNPLKRESSPTSFEHRLKMVQLAVDGLPNFKVLEIEKDLSLPSYTLKTLEALFKELGSKKNTYEFYMIIGEDCIPGFMKWNSPEKIITMVHLLVGSRHHALNVLLPNFDKDVKTKIEESWVQTPLMDISATTIRERLRFGLPCRHLLQRNVIHYIENHQLYVKPNSIVS